MQSPVIGINRLTPESYKAKERFFSALLLILNLILTLVFAVVQYAFCNPQKTFKGITFPDLYGCHRIKALL